MRTIWLVVLLLLLPLPVAAQEAWCLAHPAECVCSEPLQDAGYTVEWSDPNNWAMLGTTPNTKHCVYETHTNSYMVSWGAQGSVSIGTNAAILALLPNRGAAMQRYIRATGDYLGPGSLSATTIRLGHGEIDLGSAKRLSMRFYRYNSPDFEFAYQEHVAPHQTNTCGEFHNEPCMCTNGKIAHSSAGAYTRPWVVMQSYNNQIGNTYGFIDSSPWDWRWAGHSGFEGFYGWSKNAGSSPQNLQSLRGHWVRYEIVVRRPRQADSSTQGYDYEIYLTNVTDGGATQQDTKFSNGCTDCMPSGGPNFTWNTGTYPLGDMNALHVEDYRASDPDVSAYADNYCYGWQAYAYLTIAKWDTDAGQMIGAASEVEGGGVLSKPSAPTGVLFK